jgi:hypothetical protein
MFARSLDSSGNVYITGTTDSANFPLANALQAANMGGGGDAFITKISGSTAGPGMSYCSGTACDPSNGLYVAPYTQNFTSGGSYSPDTTTVSAHVTWSNWPDTIHWAISYHGSAIGSLTPIVGFSCGAATSFDGLFSSNSRAGLPLKAFKCGWFDERDYFEFFPLTGVYKRRNLEDEQGSRLSRLKKSRVVATDLDFPKDS